MWMSAFAVAVPQGRGAKAGMHIHQTSTRSPKWGSGDAHADRMSGPPLIGGRGRPRPAKRPSGALGAAPSSSSDQRQAAHTMTLAALA